MRLAPLLAGLLVLVPSLASSGQDKVPAARQTNKGKANANVVGNGNQIRIDARTVVRIYRLAIPSTETVRLKDPSASLVCVFRTPRYRNINMWSHIDKATRDAEAYYAVVRAEPGWAKLPRAEQERRRRLAYADVLPKEELVALAQTGVRVSVLGGCDDLDRNASVKFVRVRLLNGLDKGKTGFVEKRFVAIES